MLISNKNKYLHELTVWFGVQAGLVEVLVRKFRLVGAVCGAYLACTVALHGACLLHAWGASAAGGSVAGVHDSPAIILLFTAHRCCQLFATWASVDGGLLSIKRQRKWRQLSYFHTRGSSLVSPVLRIPWNICVCEHNVQIHLDHNTTDIHLSRPWICTLIRHFVRKIK